jgi:hypothetical protein
MPDKLLSRRDNPRSGRPSPATAPANLTTNNGLRVAERGQRRAAARPPTAAGVLRRRPRRRVPSVAAADLPQARVVNEFWYLLVGVLLIAIALLGKRLDRLPVSPAMI